MPDDQNRPTSSMPAPPVRRSPFDGVWQPGNHGRIGFQGPGVTLSAMRDMSAVRIHLGSSPTRMTPELSDALGLSGWPEVGRVQDSGDVRAIWGGPDHATLTAPDSVGLHDRIRKLAHVLPHGIVDQSHGHAILRVSGPKARDLLAKGTAVDLHPKVMAEDHVAHTTLFHHAVTIDRRRGPATFDIHVMRGFAADLLARVRDHAAEYGYRMS